MPICYNASSSRKSNGFSIDDIIKTNELTNSSNRLLSSSYLPPIAWLPTQATSLYQLQRESMLQYLRHTNQFPNPGPMAAFFLNSYRKPKRNRTAFTPTQLLKLENAFEKNHYIVGQERKELAKSLNLPEAKAIWYQNRRTKHKRLVNEDGNSSTNENDHQNESDTTTKNSDEHLWNNEDKNDHDELNIDDQDEKSNSN